MSIKKAFDREVFDKHDDRARVAVIKSLNNDGLFARANDDLYGPDLLVYSGYKHKYYVEVEVKVVWKAKKKFPWDTVQIPARKLKFTKGRKDCEFWILREDLKYCLIVPDEVLRKSPIVEVPNKYVPEGEEFVTVPIELCIKRKL